MDIAPDPLSTDISSVTDGVFNTDHNDDFNRIAISVFRYQAAHCSVYNQFISYLGIDPVAVASITHIPFLPVALFKNHRIYCAANEPEIMFSSSGTTGMQRSTHAVASLNLYKESFTRGFNLFYGDPREYILLALLPGYLERQGSSLVYMADRLIKATCHPLSGFYLHDLQGLIAAIEKARATGRKILLLGVTHALVKLATDHHPNLTGVIVMETGGMKGHGKEMVREELHTYLCSRFNVSSIHSEYGMTELLSQAYSAGDGQFSCPPWMRVLTRDTDDPLTLRNDNRTGGISIIDLANVYSCSFIATQDLGRVYSNGRFEVLGRFDNSDVRGCNLLI